MKQIHTDNSILPPEYPKVFTDQPTPKVTFSDIPVTLRCPSCGLNTLTTLEYKNGLLTYLASGGICLIGNYKANHKGEMKFGKWLSCGKFHARNSCAFRNAKCFKCGKIEHIQSVCKATVHFASSSTKSRNLNLNNSDVSSDHLSLSTISKGNAHIQKRLHTSLVSFHDFIVDTGSIESIISFKNLKSSDPNVVVRPTGHRLPIRGCCELLIRDDNSSYIPCEFLVSKTGLSIRSLKNLKRLEVELSFLVPKENSDTLLKELIAMCAKRSGGTKIQHIKLQVQGDPVFLKR
ncbi:unnamed protein product [Schistosoma margrebowiei]|uniref:Uncharacterized protein n=1 Tax=Schistosoma margrebowiei TaxID=48269 RepID=A0A183MJN5_9TREM|nr:unnamed protein product [Schistosoma margrebowiei]